MLGNEYSFDNEALADCDYSSWREDDDIPSLPALEGDEKEIKEGTWIKTLIPNKLRPGFQNY